jgi:cyclopropane fatty-acyl-phospholipid synthase-like methyltransferase
MEESKENQRKLKEKELNDYRNYIRSLYERMNKDYDNRVEIENIEKYHEFFKDCNENIKIDEKSVFFTIPPIQKKSNHILSYYKSKISKKLRFTYFCPFI